MSLIDFIIGMLCIIAMAWETVRQIRLTANTCKLQMEKMREEFEHQFKQKCLDDLKESFYQAFKQYYAEEEAKKKGE